MTMQQRALDEPMSDEEAAATFGDGLAATDDAGGNGTPAGTVREDSDVPEWASEIPPNLKIPVGVQVTWLRIRARWTVAPHKGDRVLLCWPLNEVEEGQAMTRSRGDQYRLVNELSKATIRLVDGVPANRTGVPSAPGAVSTLWNELGPKGKHLVRTYYTRAHTLTEEETQDFFLNCVASSTAAPG